jgi:hypothetical protein
VIKWWFQYILETDVEKYLMFFSQLERSSEVKTVVFYSLCQTVKIMWLHFNVVTHFQNLFSTFHEFSSPFTAVFLMRGAPLLCALIDVTKSRLQ